MDLKIVSIDIGTTNIKAAYFEGPRCHEVRQVTIETRTRDREQTQDAPAILKHVQELIDYGVRHFEIGHVVLTTAMHSLIYRDENQRDEPMILWSDNRSEPSIEALRVMDIPFYERTGTPLHPMSPLTKLYQDRTKPIAFVYDLKAYLMEALTGLFVTDISSASASGCFNIHTHTWDLEILNLIHKDITQFPRVVSVTYQAPMQHGDRVLTVTIGATDGVMASAFFMQDAYRHQTKYVMSIGTSIGVRYYATKPVLSSTHTTFCYIFKKQAYLCGNASNNGGNLYQWVSDTYFNGTLPFEKLVDFLEMANPEQIELLAKPYVFGERGPFWRINQNLQFNIQSSDHTITAQAIFLGMIANIDLMLESIGFDHNHAIFLTGGFLKNSRMAQRVADLLNVTLLYLEDENSVCEAAVSLLGVTLPTKPIIRITPHSMRQSLHRQKQYILQEP